MKDSTAERACVVCSQPFTHHMAKVVACSPACRRLNHLRISREHAARKYVAVDHPVRACLCCGIDFKPPRSDSVYCGDICSQREYDQRRAQAMRPDVRRCCRCHAVDVPFRPGVPVCDGCRADKRDPVRAAERERRRRFRKYGIDEEEYDAMLVEQGNRCAICRTDTPTSKGWAIDHCHESNMVRGILCAPCNSAIGLLGENPAVIARAAEYVKRNTQIRLSVA